ncbi:hypothetical protein C0Q70_20852 [Pomacea canaliculata]|uniref:Endonuclease/exonuclease/phosphatase domain-containing protein n=1 Tax=Pomacea canaliculata TaxID=400727 RepID=A0A2T7NAV4_POMCA|nr:hypothetical protein C0Q70_20852 [Pomacea canaliculata]
MTPSCALPVLLVIISRALEQGVTACSGGTRSILTFNSDLSPSSRGYDQRKSVVPRALAEHAHAGDFMCLQEVWLESDLREIIKYVESNFPYHYSALHSAVSVLSKAPGQQRRRLFPGVASTPCNWKLIPFFM